MEKFERRDFLKKASVGIAGGVAAMAGCSPASRDKTDAPAVQTGRKFEWKMVTTWPPHFPILGEGADLMAKWIDEMSGGQLKITVYGGGELIPPLEPSFSRRCRSA